VIVFKGNLISECFEFLLELMIYPFADFYLI